MTVRHYWNHSHSYNFHLWVHLCLFKFLFSANTLLQTSHLKHWRWDLFLCLSSFFLWLKSLLHPGMSHSHSWQSFMWYLKSFILLKTVLQVGHFISSSTPISRSSLCFCAFSFQSCFKKGKCKCISTVFAMCVFTGKNTGMLLQLYLN